MSEKTPCAWLEHYQPRALDCNQVFRRPTEPLELYQLTVVHYSYADVVRRVLEQVKRSRKPLKEIHDGVQITKDQWSRKKKLNADGTGGTRTSFTYEELTRIANYFGADPGWPFIDWDLASANRRSAEALASLTARLGSGPPSMASSEAAAHPTRRKRGTRQR